jgi:two-component system nitrogen regulation sensor histidine kinase NtrY
MEYTPMGFIIASYAKLLAFARKAKIANVITTLLITAIVLSSVVTYALISNPDNYGFEPQLESNLLNINLGLLLCLAVIVSRKLIHLYLDRKRGRSGSGLLLRLVLISTIVAIIPAVVVAFSSSFYLNLGIKSWFDERVNRAVIESVAVADAYLKEHKEIVGSDALVMANEINSRNVFYGVSSSNLNSYLEGQSERRFLAEALIFRKEQYQNRSYELIPIAGSNTSLALNPLSNVTKESLERADKGCLLYTSDAADDM